MMEDKKPSLSKKLERLKRERDARLRSAQAQKSLEEKAGAAAREASEAAEADGENKKKDTDVGAGETITVDYSQASETSPYRPDVPSSKSVPGRTEQIKKAWSEIDKDESLPLKSKLEQLLSLQGAPRPRKPVTAKPTPAPHEPLKILENRYSPDARYGNITISAGLGLSGDILTCLSKDEAFRGLDLSSALFLDLETTGLSGGTGVLPFLVGLGYYRDGHFHVLQYFLGEPAEEERMIAQLAEFFVEMKFQSIVTYNGKTFDLPLLETRFIINRQSLILRELPHLDFLFPARRLWRHRYESCRLYNLALDVINTGRTEDIPSAEIPWRYFQYLQTGEYDLVEPIIYHNAEDILSLLGLVISGGLILSDDPDSCRSDARDLFGAGKILESFGDEEQSLRYFEKALDGKLSDDLTLSVKRRLSIRHKKKKKWEAAVGLWEEMVDNTSVTRDTLFSFREMAMYYEHKKKDYEKARAVAEEGMVASFGFSSAYEKDFRRRLERIKSKLRKELQDQSKKTQDPSI